MMSRPFAALLLMAVVLMAGLAALWLDRGAWRWQVPVPVSPMLGEVGVPGSESVSAVGDFPHTLARPLFNASRRPPPNAAVASADAPLQAPVVSVDGMRLHALMSDAAGRGVAVLTLDGRVQRLRLGESAGGWRLESIEGREARVVSDSGERRLRLLRPGEPAVAAAPAPAAAAAESDAGAAPVASSPGHRNSADRVRERIMRNNALRVQNGLDPEPLPPE